MNTTTRQPSAKQTKTFAVAVKTALLERGITVQQLSALIGRPRSSVSKAIHQNRFPKIRKAIRANLSLS